MNVNMITCGGQATIPMVAAVSRAATGGVVRRDRRLGLVASRPGPARAPTSTSSPRTTAAGVETIGGAERGKAIIILNPAEPPMIMRDTIFCAVPPDADRDAIIESIVAMEKAVQEYVPGYRLLQEPQIDEPSAATQGQTKVSIFVEVEGAGDYLPPYSGNLDIMTAAAAQVGENIASSMNVASDCDRDRHQRARPHLVRHPRRRALGRARPPADRHLPARRVAPQAAPVHRAGGATTSSRRSTPPASR